MTTATKSTYYVLVPTSIYMSFQLEAEAGLTDEQVLEHLQNNEGGYPEFSNEVWDMKDILSDLRHTSADDIEVEEEVE